MDKKRFFFVEERSGGRVWVDFVGYMTDEEAEGEKGTIEYDRRRNPLNSCCWLMSDNDIEKVYGNAGWNTRETLDYIEDMGCGYICE